MAVREFRRFDLGEPMSLHWEALPARQREVLRACVGPTHRWRAYLAGGTALALHLGHRQSEDLDWFTPETLDTDDLLAIVTGMGFPVEIDQNQTGTFLAVVGGVKFSVFRYRYDVLDPFVDAKGVNLASIRDLAAMKLTALIGRATKRDYVDIHELLVGGTRPCQRWFRPSRVSIQSPMRRTPFELSRSSMMWLERCRGCSPPPLGRRSRRISVVR